MIWKRLASVVFFLPLVPARAANTVDAHFAVSAPLPQVAVPVLAPASGVSAADTTLRSLRAVDPYALNKNPRGWDAARSLFDQAAPYHADALVIGSGPGASVATLRLAQAGRTVLVLERGNWFDYPHRPYGAGIHALWLPKLGIHGHMQFRFLGPVISWLGSGVGGGTHVWAKTLVRLTRDVLTSLYPREISPDAMHRYYYPIVESMMGAAPYPGYAPYSEAPKTRAFQRMGEAMQKEDPRVQSFPLPLAIQFAREGEPTGRDVLNASGVRRRSYDLGSVSLLRGDWGSANTTDSNYLAEALKTGRVKILTLQEADRIEPLAGGGYRVQARDHFAGKDASYTGRELYVGAGAIGTTELLLRNVQVHGTLPNLSGRLGTGYGFNGDRVGFGLTSRPSYPDVGPTNTWGVLFPDEKGEPEVFVVDGAYPHPISMVALAVLDLFGLATMRAEARLIGLQRWVQRHVTSRLSRAWPLPLLGMNRQYHSIGTITLDRKGRARMTMDLDSNAGPDKRMDERFAQMAASVEPADRLGRALALFFRPLTAWIYRATGKVEAPHNMGGAPMGVDAAAGVVDHRGAVHGYEGLFLVDGSIHPPAMGMNPTNTIMAVTERNMTRLLFAEHRDRIKASVRRILSPVPAGADWRVEWTRRLAFERAILAAQRVSGLAARPEGRWWARTLDALESALDEAPQSDSPKLLKRFFSELDAATPESIETAE